MTKDKSKISDEIDELQQFINTCETALDYGLGFDATTYDKYNSAIQRQRELSELLKGAEETKRGLFTSAQLVRKEANLHVDKCQVEAVVELDINQFNTFKRHLLHDYDFIHDNREYMFRDENDVSHCLLVLGEGEEDGILVESEGSNYARYSALLPNARSFMQKNIKVAADYLISKSINGNLNISFEAISDYFDTIVTPHNKIGEMLIAELNLRDELSEIRVTSDYLKATCSDSIKPISNNSDKKLTLLQLIKCSLEDVHLMHVIDEVDFDTFVYLDETMFTEQGKHDWADVLNATVNRIFLDSYGIQVEITDCEPQRLGAFYKMLTGNCTLAESERWLKPVINESSFNLNFDDGGMK